MAGHWAASRIVGKKAPELLSIATATAEDQAVEVLDAHRLTPPREVSGAGHNTVFYFLITWETSRV